MKIYAQHGFGPKDKLTRGLQEKIIAGVILSPRYWDPNRMRSEILNLQSEGSEIAVDPEYFASDYIAHPSPNLGALEDWPYFRRPRKPELITGSAIPGVISEALTAQLALGVNQLITPNIYIRQADSIDTAIALNFLNKAKSCADQITTKPVYGTLAIHRDALLAGQNFRDLLDSLTGMGNPLDGYYLVVGSREQQSTGKYIRSDLSHPEVIANWMYANYVLSLNGARVINGYSFLLAPLLGICGSSASASGWTSGLRKFCIDRYVRVQGKASPPSLRYVSNRLLSHVRQADLDAFTAIVPEVVNGLSLDDVYAEREPNRTEEALQSWEALKASCDQSCVPNTDIRTALDEFLTRIANARLSWDELQSAGFSNEVEQNLERLASMESAIQLFKGWAELA